jgi:hypothetical protein
MHSYTNIRFRPTKSRLSRLFHIRHDVIGNSSVQQNQLESRPSLSCLRAIAHQAAGSCVISGGFAGSAVPSRLNQHPIRYYHHSSSSLLVVTCCSVDILHHTTSAMSSDSSSSALSDAPVYDAATQQALWLYIADSASEAPAGTNSRTVYEAAVRHMFAEYHTAMTIADVKALVATAKSKRRRRNATEKQAKRRASEREKENEEWEQQLAQRKTRKQRELFIAATPRPAPGLSGIARSASVATDTARVACIALDDLKQRNKAFTTPRRQRGEEEEEDGGSGDRLPLQDISAASTNAAVAATAVASSSSSGSSSTSSSDGGGTSSSSTTTILFPTGIMNPHDRLTVQQKKKEMKRMIAEESADMVKREAERRAKQDEVIELTGKVMAAQLEILPLLREGLLQLVARGRSERRQ